MLFNVFKNIKGIRRYVHLCARECENFPCAEYLVQWNGCGSMPISVLVWVCDSEYVSLHLCECFSGSVCLSVEVSV